jgi:hypothetical protein
MVAVLAASSKSTLNVPNSPVQISVGAANAAVLSVASKDNPSNNVPAVRRVSPTTPRIFVSALLANIKTPLRQLFGS